LPSAHAFSVRACWRALVQMSTWPRPSFWKRDWFRPRPLPERFVTCGRSASQQTDILRGILNARLSSAGTACKACARANVFTEFSCASRPSAPFFPHLRVCAKFSPTSISSSRADKYAPGFVFTCVQAEGGIHRPALARRRRKRLRPRRARHRHASDRCRPHQ
jgi:hypothetical protein